MRTIASTLKLRSRKRGSAVAVAMSMFILVSAGGTAFLATNFQYNLQVASKGIDMRLYNAAEAGIETCRGQFTLIAGAQDDWSLLFDSSNPTTVWKQVGSTLTINGASVVVSCKALTVGAVPKARLRSIATIAGRQRAVEQDIKIATFSDYALYYNKTSDLSLAANFTCWGPLMCRASINCNDNTGIQFNYGGVFTGGTVNNEGGSPYYWNPSQYPKEGYSVPEINPSTVSLAVPRTKAVTTNTLYYQNTFEIEFTGSTYIRRYWKRTSTTTGTINPPPATAAKLPGESGYPASPSSSNDDFELYNNSTGAVLPAYVSGSGTRYPSSGSDIHYIVATETVTIPDEGVIYLDSDSPSVEGYISIGGGLYQGAVDSDAQNTNPAKVVNYYVQPIMDTSSNGGDNDCLSGGRRIDDASSPLDPGDSDFNYFPCVLVKGTISGGKRVTLAAEGNVIISNCIKYQSLLDTPEARRSTNKTGSSATSFSEMLGINSNSRIWLRTRWWDPLPTASEVNSISGDTHYNNQFCMDGSYFGYDRVSIASGSEAGSTAPNSLGNSWSSTEYWVCGGLLNGGEQQSSMGSFTRRNYDWDYRLATTTPPYFLRAYNLPAARLSFTWRTYIP
ncbi:MAG: hypothetical protein IT462_02570 [Planctomycetes bacterium]|nr:hypothetical protein [Planctomycetota bacterium]